jgi:hypothetical protein
MGIYFSALAYELLPYMKLWLSITILLIFVALLQRETNKTSNKIFQGISYDFINEKGLFDYSTFSKNLISKFFAPNGFILISFVVFLFLHDYSNTLTFGLLNYVLSFVK